VQFFLRNNWIVKGLLPQGYGLLGGRRLVGKSWLALSLALAVSQGRIALGQPEYITRNGKVLYLALGDNLRRLKFRQTLLLAGSKPGNNLVYAINWPRFGEGGLREIEHWLRKNRDAKLVVIDPLMPVKPVLKKTDNHIGSRLSQFAARHHVCLLAVHDTRHAGKDKIEDCLNQYAKDTGIAGRPEFSMLLRRAWESDIGTLKIVGRDTEQVVGLDFRPESGGWKCLGKAS